MMLDFPSTELSTKTTTPEVSIGERLQSSLGKKRMNVSNSKAIFTMVVKEITGLQECYIRQLGVLEVVDN